MIYQGLDFETGGARYRVSTRGFLRARVRIIADDGSLGTVTVVRGYGKGGPEVAYSPSKSVAVDGTPTELDVSDCPEIVFIVGVAGNDTFDLEVELGSPCVDDFEVIPEKDLAADGPLFMRTLLNPGVLERVTTVCALENADVKGAARWYAYGDHEAPASYEYSSTDIDLELAVNTQEFSSVYAFEVYCTGPQASQSGDFYLYRVSNPYIEGIVPSNVALVDAINVFTQTQFFETSLIVGDISSGVTTLTTNSAANRSVAFPNVGGELMVLNSSQTPATGDFVRYNGAGLDAVPLYGSSFPSSPADGQMFYRTDLDMPELFVYDSTRGKWLGELRCWTFGRATASSSSLLLSIDGSVIGSSSRGVLTPSALTVVGIEAFNANSGVTCDFNLYEGSTNLTTLMSFSSDRANHDHTLNYDLDADAGWPQKYVRADNISAGTLSNPIVKVYLRRRES